MLEPSQPVPWNTTPRPFVKWAGGKGQLLERLERYFPKDLGVYYEPFLGGGAVFFHLVNKRSKFDAVLSDTNSELITTYRVIKEQVEDLIGILKSHRAEYRADPKKYFYSVRAAEPELDVEKAARLIFLNKTCFNGLYRVNSKGKFNVPCGWFLNPSIFDPENLRSVSAVLNWSNAKLLVADFREATKDAKDGDFIYFDPPYLPKSITASFTCYTAGGFSAANQKELEKWSVELSNRGCKVLLSNSDTPEIHEMYKDYKIERVQVLRAINCKGDQRKGHTELIIRNYDSDN
jgi:DNA adenine methylase